jgi:RimJ/RimL family protein N-acetyltransferase
MSESIWAGRKVRIRAWEPGDWEAQARWHADTEGERRTYHIPFPFSVAGFQKQAEEYAQRRSEDSDVFDGIISGLEGEALGVIGGHDCNRTHGTFSIAYYVAPEYRRNGFATEAIQLLLRFYFFERRYQKANAITYDFNHESQKLLEGLGFQPEGRQRRMQYTNDAYHDFLLYGITVEEFRERHRDWLMANTAQTAPSTPDFSLPPLVQ